jgi:hypothetical protein
MGSARSPRAARFTAYLQARNLGHRPRSLHRSRSVRPGLLKLDQADPRLNLPVAIYNLSDPKPPARFGTASQLKKGQSAPPAFFALERPGKGTTPIFAGPMGTLKTGTEPEALARTNAPTFAAPMGTLLTFKSGERNAEPLFHALPADFRQPPTTTTPLFEFVHKASGQHTYSTGSAWASPGFERSEKPIALVWRNPIRLILPAE